MGVQTPAWFPTQKAKRQIFVLFMCMQPTDISSFNNGSVETNIQKKKIDIE